MSAPEARPLGGGIPWLVVAGVLTAALSLRGPIVAPAPVLRDIEADLGVGSATVALLTTAPVLMFALLTPLAAYLIRRSGAELALMGTLVGVLAGTLVRALPGFGWMLVGMIVIGAAITVGNIVVPVVIRRDVPPDQVGLVTGAYVAMLNVGSLLTSLATAPLASVVGWSAALLLWSVITVAGIVVWGAHLARRGRAAPRTPAPREQAARTARPEIDPRTLTGPVPVVSRRRSFTRSPAVWLLTATFGCQAFTYYGFTTWLPVLSTDLLDLDRNAAGALASIFQGGAVVGALVIPLLARVTPSWVPAAVVCAAWIALTFGMVLAPSLVVVWLLAGSLAHAGGFVVVFTLLVQVARTDAQAAGMSALVQGGGYALGAVAGPLLGGLHEVTGGWSAGLWVLAAATIAYGILLFAALGATRAARA